MTDVQLVTKAAHFAAQAHRAHSRKDADATPHINHLTEVAHLLADAGCSLDVVVAGYLHDTIEDVQIRYETLAAEFGWNVADLVLSVTDDRSLPKAVRKQLQIVHAAEASPEVAALKMADKISNLRAVVETPPPTWSLERRQEYIDWSHRVVSALPYGNEFLRTRYEETRRLLAPMARAAGV